VATLDNLSAHADGAEIIDWLHSFKSAPRRTFITHGEAAAVDAMRQRIERELHWPCHMPYYLESVSLD
jgi:metallo-beta-lactamase family protein